ncbi:MAG: hypothetical protein QOI57_2785 [Rubrobacteraceae bacterium]|nr:hypothetical protein [Rubrobacteraceae bacterium]
MIVQNPFVVGVTTVLVTSCWTRVTASIHQDAENSLLGDWMNKGRDKRCYESRYKTRFASTVRTTLSMMLISIQDRHPPEHPLPPPPKIIMNKPLPYPFSPYATDKERFSSPHLYFSAGALETYARSTVLPELGSRLGAALLATSRY